MIRHRSRITKRWIAPGLQVRRLRARKRRGAAALDYVLTMGVVLPLAAFLYVAGPKIMNLVNEMTTVLVGWPFM